MIQVLELCKKDTWIMDGNYTSTLPLRINYANTIIYLDTPRWKCLLRSFFRTFRVFHNMKRQDLPGNCSERINLSLYKWVWNYPSRSKEKSMSMLKEFSGQVSILKTNKDINIFLDNLTSVELKL